MAKLLDPQQAQVGLYTILLHSIDWRTSLPCQAAIPWECIYLHG